MLLGRRASSIVIVFTLPTPSRYLLGSREQGTYLFLHTSPPVRSATDPPYDGFLSIRSCWSHHHLGIHIYSKADWRECSLHKFQASYWLEKKLLVHIFVQRTSSNLHEQSRSNNTNQYLSCLPCSLTHSLLGYSLTT